MKYFKNKYKISESNQNFKGKLFAQLIKVNAKNIIINLIIFFSN